jgi:uncharacterized membrane protein YtjA (UPF0391 family)
MDFGEIDQPYFCLVYCRNHATQIQNSKLSRACFIFVTAGMTGAMLLCLRYKTAIYDTAGNLHDLRLRSDFKKEEAMLSWTITFLVVALIAALLGFGGIAGAAAGIAKILFFVFLIAFVVTLVMGRRPVA